MKKQKQDSQFEEVKIRDIRAKHIDKKIKFRGQIIQASEVRPQCVTAKFECPKCGTIISVLQVTKTLREPTKCCCGRKGEFELKSKEMVDAQRIIVGQGKKYYDKECDCKIASERFQVFLQEELCDPKYNILDNLGKNVTVTGTIREVPIYLDDGKISLRYELALECEKLEMG